ncbi:F-box domain-containing protein [Mycena kentingensis (nom. inval.)]|nr:F-box domain-containing protein [Mycena kentingensis (nom. inval.)]
MDAATKQLLRAEASKLSLQIEEKSSSLQEALDAYAEDELLLAIVEGAAPGAPSQEGRLPSVRAAIATFRQDNDLDAEEYQSLALEVKLQLASKKMEAEELDKAIKSLQSQLYSLQSQLDAAGYPVVDLPTEILTGIFALCLSGAPSDGYTTPPPALLGTCRRWRQVALGTATLWSRFEMDITNCLPSDPRLGRLHVLMGQHLARAGSCPLSIALRFVEGNQRTNRRMVPRFLDIVRRYSATIECLAIRDADVTNADLSSAPFPTLHTLTFYPRNIDRASRFELFRDTPVLQSAHFDLEALPLSPTHFHWSEMRFFSGGPLKVAQCLELLQKMPQISSASLSVGPSGASPAVPGCPASIDLPNLQRLAIRLAPQLIETRVFDALSLPRSGHVELLPLLAPKPGTLTALELEGVLASDAPVITSFLQRISDSLEKLTLRFSLDIRVAMHSANIFATPGLGLERLSGLHLHDASSFFVEQLFATQGQSQRLFARTDFLPVLAILSIEVGHRIAPTQLSQLVSAVARSTHQRLGEPNPRADGDTDAKTSIGPLRLLRVVFRFDPRSAPKVSDEDLVRFHELRMADDELEIHVGSYNRSIV